MSEVKRFDIEGDDWEIVVSENGDWVTSECFCQVTAERDALQQNMNVADQRADDLQTQLDELEQRRRAEFEAGAVAERRVEVLEGLLRASLIAMKRIYQAGYDRIVDAGGSCDTPEYMMESDPTAREIRSTLKPATEGASHE